MKASDLMTPNPVALTPEDPTTRAAEIMRDMNIGIIPVVEDRQSMRLAGVITDRDIAIRCVASHHDGTCPVREHMTRDMIDTVAPQDDADAVVARMGMDQIRRIPVVENGDRLVGIIAQADVALKLGRSRPDAVEQALEQVSEP